MAKNWWQEQGSDAGEPAELRDWARTQPSLAAAWTAAPRADWLLRLAQRGGLGDARARTAAASLVARVGARRQPRKLAAAALRSGEPFEDRAEATAGVLRAVLIAVAACAPLYLVLRDRGRTLQLAATVAVYFAVFAAMTGLGRLVRRKIVARAADALDDAAAWTIALAAAERASTAASPGETAAALKIVRTRLPAPA